MRYIMHTPPSLPLPSWTPSHDEDRSLKEEGRRWRSFRFSRRHGALRSHRRACANAKRDKFQHACFVWETSIKPEKKKSAYEGERGGGANALIKLSLPIDGCLCPEARPLPYAPICAEDTSLNKTPSFPRYTGVWCFERTIHKTCLMTSICFSVCICNSPSVSSYS